MKKQLTIFACLILAMVILSSCGKDTKTSQSSNEKETVKVAEAAKNIADNHERNPAQVEQTAMTIKISDKKYSINLDSNITAQDIVKNMPLELNMVRYANHEYYDKLSFTPRLAKERTTFIKAGHVYYWHVWNAFVINYIDYDISPYQVVHIGEVTDNSINELLKNSEEKIAVSVSAN